tara:strand:- start:28030 stop:28773 length:744 start_codon:yes stop_codon:yes gene_type:complete
MKLILLRHGESQWNLENRFTGWKDVELTKNGTEEAKFAAQQLVSENLNIDTIHTSILKRAVQTTEIVSSIINFDINLINYDWRLNERHYGALQGLNKSETAKKFGEEQVKIWRRSFDIPPPPLEKNDNRHPSNNPTFQKIPQDYLPVGESLKMVIKRLIPFWEEYFEKIKLMDGCHLIVAHSNSLRAIIKILDNLSEESIISVNIPTGVPLVYYFASDFKVLEKKYLINEIELRQKQEQIIKQGKIK